MGRPSHHSQNDRTTLRTIAPNSESSHHPRIIASHQERSLFCLYAVVNNTNITRFRVSDDAFLIEPRRREGREEKNRYQ
ncbi:MAG TPA: hypothetical protein VK203_28310 [Nostocaceae cyanobacterium]|nr:hypothetical protein [Nostocaceae cyanobacterium]